MSIHEEQTLDLFHQWLQLNGVELRGCKIKFCDSSKGFGLFSANDVSDGILLVVPIDLAITPMRVLQDPLLGPVCRAMYEEGEVDDRFLMILFLTAERLRKSSSWKPYLDMIPSTFGSPLWFTDDEFIELKGTTLYRACISQRKSLQSLFEEKVKDLVKRLLILDGDSESEVTFEDFLWANSVFWTRALNIPFPQSYVFPQTSEETDGCSSKSREDPETLRNSTSVRDVVSNEDEKNENGPGISRVDGAANGATPHHTQGETLWIEGLVPGIDFCNHDLKAAATWEVDGTGSATRIPLSMYLLSVNQGPTQVDKEITICYGNKGNEELLFLYGFIIEDNPDDYLMVHYPVESLQRIPFSNAKAQLLKSQNAELRCLLPRRLLDHGFYGARTSDSKGDYKCTIDKICNYSWSGQRKTPSYFSKLVFPEDFLTSLRTIAMKEDELSTVSSLLQELVGSDEEREPSESDVRAAVWEACGDSGALQLLVDLLNMKMMDLEEGSGTEESDTELLQKACVVSSSGGCTSGAEAGSSQREPMSRNRWASIVYRRGQKQLTRLFLREAEYALQLSLSQ